MGKQNRDTLKRYFRHGALPSESEFADLLDSMVNQVDEGIGRTPDDGLFLSTQGKNRTLASFARDSAPESKVWQMELGSNDELSFRSERTALHLGHDGMVGIGTNAPQQELDVSGFVRSAGRIGMTPATVPLADGEWHAITGELTGLQGFEVVAGLSVPDTGYHSLLFATALNAYHPQGWWFNLFGRKRTIKTQQAYYLSRDCRLQLRWEVVSKADHSFRLIIRCKCPLADSPPIRCAITSLWAKEPGGNV